MPTNASLLRNTQSGKLPFIRDTEAEARRYRSKVKAWAVGIRASGSITRPQIGLRVAKPLEASRSLHSTRNQTLKLICAGKEHFRVSKAARA